MTALLFVRYRKPCLVINLGRKVFRGKRGLVVRAEEFTADHRVPGLIGFTADYIV